jgi:DNA-binding transcriptional LysR family regulator
MPHLPLELRPSTADEAVAGLQDGSVNAAFLRSAPSAVPQIRLYEELPVVVIPKDHDAAALDSLTPHDLATLVVLDYAENTAHDTVELVAANVGVAVMPQSVARSTSRRDVVARPLTESDSTFIDLAWVTQTAEVDEFIGIVRGRTANSSRAEDDAPVKKLSASQKAAAKRERSGRPAPPEKKKKPQPSRGSARRPKR